MRKQREYFCHAITVRVARRGSRMILLFWSPRKFGESNRGNLANLYKNRIHDNDDFQFSLQEEEEEEDFQFFFSDSMLTITSLGRFPCV